jgi:hypothetical protein
MKESTSVIAKFRHNKALSPFRKEEIKQNFTFIINLIVGLSCLFKNKPARCRPFYHMTYGSLVTADSFKVIPGFSIGKEIKGLI